MHRVVPEVIPEMSSNLISATTLEDTAKSANLLLAIRNQESLASSITIEKVETIDKETKPDLENKTLTKNDSLVQIS